MATSRPQAVDEFNGFVDMPAKAAQAYLIGSIYTLNVRVGGATREVLVRPYYRRRLVEGQVRVYFRRVGKGLSSL